MRTTVKTQTKIAFWRQMQHDICGISGKKIPASSSKSWHYPPKVHQSALWTVLGDKFSN